MQKNNKYLKAILTILFSCFSINFYCQDLPRKIDLNLKISFANPGILIEKNSVQHEEVDNKFQNKDLILTINDSPILSMKDYNKIIRSLKSDTKYNIKVRRGSEIHVFSYQFDPAPKESFEDLMIDYDFFTTDYGYDVRTVISKPKKSEITKFPAVLFVQWLSCSSIENRGLNHGFSNLIWALTKTGYLVQRTEKPGVGDSEGPDCSDLDFYTEVEIHRQALRELLSRDDIDPNRIILLGWSMGSNIAAILASENPSVKAIIFTGGYYKTWQERLLDFERRRLTYTTNNDSIIYDKMLKYYEFYADYFNKNRTPGEILSEKPHLREIWNGLPSLQYGRPIKFYQQANNVNMGEIWSSISIPVLALYGEYDWIMDRDDHEMVINAVKNPKSKFELLHRTDHNLYYYPDTETKKEAFNKRSDIPNTKISMIVADWLKTLDKS